MGGMRPLPGADPAAWRRGGLLAIVLFAFAALAFAGTAWAQGANRTRPVLQSAAVDGAVLVLTYDEALLGDGSPRDDGIQQPQSVQFQLYVNNAARPLYPDTVAVSGRTVTLCEPRLGTWIQGRMRSRGLSTTRGRFFSRSCGVHPMKWSRGASFHAAVLKPSIASGQPSRSWTA